MKNFNLPAMAGVSHFIPRLVVSFLSLVFVVAAIISARAFAQDNSPPTIVITASRFAETVDESLAPVTVITREDIEQRQATSVAEVLRSVPGLTMSSNGNDGQLTTLFLRGTNSNHVLVLIDGVKVGAAANGLTQFEHLPLDQIEKIEVVRGPRSALYGSEALGGVIQILTRRGTHNTRLAASGGTHNAGKFEVGGGARGRYGWHSFTASSTNSDGYDVCDASFCTPNGGDPTGEDDDGYSNDSFAGRAHGKFSDTFSLEGNVFRSQSDTEFDGFQNRSEHLIQTKSANVVWRELTGSWESSLLYAQSDDDLTAYTTSSSNNFVTEREQATWQTEWRGEGDNVVFGVDYVDDIARRSPSDYVINERDNLGVFALVRTDVFGNDVEFAGRVDDDSQFGEHITRSIGWGRDVGGNRFTASYATGYNAPTFQDLYDPVSDFGINLNNRGIDNGIFQDNPDLEPETSRSLDLGWSRGGFSFNAYRTEIENLISTEREEGVLVDRLRRDVYTPINIERARVTGAEISSAGRVLGWNIRTALSWQEAVERDGTDTDKPLLKRPEYKLDFDIHRHVGKHSFGANVYGQSESFDFGDVELERFGTLALRFELRVAAHWALGIKVSNVTGEEYQTAAGYPRDGANGVATLRYVD